MVLNENLYPHDTAIHPIEQDPSLNMFCRKYRQSRVFRLEHIRAVAYVPGVEINQENVYNQAISEPNDIDLVTVEFQFDIAALYKSFNDSFAGPKVKDQWRDKTLAEPVFAAVQLQRQQQLPDGSWRRIGKDVPRSKIDVYRQLLNIIEDVEKLSTGGMQVRLLQYKERNVQLDLLQPDCYRIASAREEWFPPSFHPQVQKNSLKMSWESRNVMLSRNAEEPARLLGEQGQLQVWRRWLPHAVALFRGWLRQQPISRDRLPLSSFIRILTRF